MPKRYPSEFRRRVLDLIAAGRPVASIADDLGVSAQTIYNWQRQDEIDRGEAAGLSSLEQGCRRETIHQTRYRPTVTLPALTLLPALTAQCVMQPSTDVPTAS